MLVDLVQELESAAIDGGVELEIHDPHLVGMLSQRTPHRTIGRPYPLSLPGSRPLQAFLAPEQLHPLVIDCPAFPQEQAVGHPPAPADVLSGDLPEALAQLGLLDIDNLAPMALGAAVLPRHPADKAFRSPVTILQNRDGSAVSFRAQKFPSASSLSIAFSSSAFARGFLSRAFSFSSWVRHLASSACVPPYCCRQRWYGGCVTSMTRQTSAAVLPWAISCSAVLS